MKRILSAIGLVVVVAVAVATDRLPAGANTDPCLGDDGDASKIDDDGSQKHDACRSVTEGSTFSFTVPLPRDKTGAVLDEVPWGGYVSGDQFNTRYSSCNGPYNLIISAFDALNRAWTSRPVEQTEETLDTVTRDGQTVTGQSETITTGYRISGRTLSFRAQVSETGSLKYTIVGTRTVTSRVQRDGSWTQTVERVACDLGGVRSVQIAVNPRGVSSGEPEHREVLVGRDEGSGRTILEDARKDVRERTADNPAPPNAGRCRVVTVDYGDQRGSMSWCGTYTDSDGNEVAPNGQRIDEICSTNESERRVRSSDGTVKSGATVKGCTTH